MTDSGRTASESAVEGPAATPGKSESRADSAAENPSLRTPDGSSPPTKEDIPPEAAEAPAKPSAEPPAEPPAQPPAEPSADAPTRGDDTPTPSRDTPSGRNDTPSASGNTPTSPNSPKIDSSTRDSAGQSTPSETAPGNDTTPDDKTVDDAAKPDETVAKQDEPTTERNEPASKPDKPTAEPDNAAAQSDSAPTEPNDPAEADPRSAAAEADPGSAAAEADPKPAAIEAEPGSAAAEPAVKPHSAEPEPTATVPEATPITAAAPPAAKPAVKKKAAVKASDGDLIPKTRAGRLLARADQAAGGYAADLALYAFSTIFALVTALSSTLLPHRAWGAVATWAYAAAFLLALLQLLGYRLVRNRVEATSRAWRLLRLLVGNGARASLTWITWATAALLPLVIQSVQRAGGRTDRAQEEVLVVERMGERLLNDGTPYLSRDAIAALPADERLTGYSPYQPGMSIFGLPRALAGDFWWTDARIWFALFTALILITAVLLLRPRSAVSPDNRPRSVVSPDGEAATPDSGVADRSIALWRSFATVRALQAVTVLPVIALTLATGGDDIPVLALCILALVFAATDRYGWAGLAVGAAAACKLFALPVVAVLAVLAMAVARGGKLLPGALGLPLLVLIPPFQVDQDAFIENVIRFPLGHGLVTSPAQSPFPGYLIAQNVPGGRYVALGLLLAVAAFITVRILWKPPRTASAAASICGWGLLAAILLMPTTRFGYVLYPIAFLVWAAALRPALRNHTATSGPSGDTALYRL